MGGASSTKNLTAYVEIDENKCNGCVLCMKVCPTKAIRVRNSLAVIEGTCIDCGECIRVCPRGAISAEYKSELVELEGSREVSLISASTALYAQYERGIEPNDVLLALRKMKLGFVIDQSFTNELCNYALQFYIRERRAKGDSSWPIICTGCPVIVRLIIYRFPTLIKHIPPLLPPREIVAREAKRRLPEKRGKKNNIRAFHITPCSAKTTSIKKPVLSKSSFLDGTIRVGDVYEQIRKTIYDLSDEESDMILHHSSGVGLARAMSGGEILDLNVKCLAVSGLSETIVYLEKIERGVLSDIDYIEFMSCPGGCVGGPFNVTDRYRAKHRLERFLRTYGRTKRVQREYARKLYDKGYFFFEKDPDTEQKIFSGLSLSEGIARMSKIEAVLNQLPRKECGVCGAPDCRSFAEDVADGKASIQECIFIKC